MTHIDALSSALKTILATWKTEVDKLDIEKLAPLPTDLSKLSNVVKNDIVKKDIYDILVAKVNNTDTNDFVSKTQYNTDKTELENKIPDVTDFVKETKLTELEKKIPDMSNLATKTALTMLRIKHLILVIQLTKQTITLKLQKFKINLLTMIWQIYWHFKI